MCWCVWLLVVCVFICSRLFDVRVRCFVWLCACVGVCMIVCVCVIDSVFVCLIVFFAFVVVYHGLVVWIRV